MKILNYLFGYKYDIIVNQDIKDIVKKKSNILGNKVFCLIGLIEILLLLIHNIVFYKFIIKYPVEIYIGVSTIIKIVFMFFMITMCLRSNYNTIYVKKILFLLTIIISVFGLVMKISPDDMITNMTFFIFTIAYLDCEFSIMVGLITFTCMIINIAQNYMLFGGIADVIWQEYFHGIIAIVIYLSSIIISKYGYNMMIKEEIERKERENEQRDFYLAHKIQSGFLNHNFPDNDYYAIFASMYPSKEVGGDFYDYFRLDFTKMVLIVADVSGKGVPASLFMVNVKTALFTNLYYGMSFEKAVEKANRMVFMNNPELQFVTIFIAEIDLSNGKMYFINAGHNKPCIITKDGQVNFIDTKADFIFGVKKFTKYNIYEKQLNIGDKLFLYTDGVTERKNEKDLLYGKDRLISILKNNKDKKVDELVKEVKNDLDLYANEAPQNDDITCLAFVYKKQKLVENHVAKNFDIAQDNYTNIISFVSDTLNKKNVSEDVISIMKVAIDEIVSNIIKFAYDESCIERNLRISIQIMDNIVEIVFIDNGKYFNPLLRINKVKTSRDIKDMSIGGMGIKMIWNMMDDMKYTRVEKYNILKIIKEC